MPSVSKKQERFMQAVAHNSSFAHKVGVAQSVGKEFMEADEAKKSRKRPSAKQVTKRMYGEN